MQPIQPFFPLHELLVFGVLHLGACRARSRKAQLVAVLERQASGLVEGLQLPEVAHSMVGQATIFVFLVHPCFCFSISRLSCPSCGLISSLMWRLMRCCVVSHWSRWMVAIQQSRCLFTSAKCASQTSAFSARQK